MSEQNNNKTNDATADHATISNAVQTGGMILIGIFGTLEEKHALLRMPGGRIRRVSVGDTVSQSTVAAISDDAMFLTGMTGQRKLSMPATVRHQKAAA